MFLKFLLAIICTEAMVELITKSKFFNPLRAKIFDLGINNKFFNWLHELLDCGYCFSVWVGMFFAILFFRNINLIHVYIDWVFMGLVLHRTSNLIHNIMDRVHGIEIR